MALPRREETRDKRRNKCGQKGIRVPLAVPQGVYRCGELECSGCLGSGSFRFIASPVKLLLGLLTFSLRVSWLEALL